MPFCKSSFSGSVFCFRGRKKYSLTLKNDPETSIFSEEPCAILYDMCFKWISDIFIFQKNWTHVDGSPVPFGRVIKRKSQWWKTLSEVNSFIFNMSGLYRYIYHVELSSKIVGIPKGPLGVYPMVQNVPFIQWWSLITSFGSIPYCIFIWGSTI